MSAPRILDEAADEVDPAAAYLERQRPGYARLVLEASEEKLRQLTRFPQSGPLIQKAPAGSGLRTFLIRRFPHSIIGGVFDNVLTIVSVAHTSRDPGYWRDRLK